MVTRTFKIIYWSNGRKKVAEVDACSKYDAKMRFYVSHSFTDIIRIEEVTK